MSIWIHKPKKGSRSVAIKRSNFKFLFWCTCVFNNLILLLYISDVWKRRNIKSRMLHRWSLPKFIAYFLSGCMGRKKILTTRLWIRFEFYQPLIISFLQIPFFMWCKLLNTLYIVLYYIFEVCMIIPRWFCLNMISLSHNKIIWIKIVKQKSKRQNMLRLFPYIHIILLGFFRGNLGSRFGATTSY